LQEKRREEKITHRHVRGEGVEEGT